MQQRTAISLIVGAAAAIWFGFLYITGAELSSGLLKPFGFTTSAVTLLAIWFNSYAWRAKIFRGWLVERPFLGGTWRATLHSTYVEDGARVAPKEVFVVIRQTLSSMTFRLYTERARSSSLSESIYRDGTDLFGLSVSYQSLPEISDRNGKSEIHYGSALFMHIDHDGTHVEGHYFTDRNTAGSLVLNERRNAYASSYAAALKLFNLNR